MALIVDVEWEGSVVLVKSSPSSILGVFKVRNEGERQST